MPAPSLPAARGTRPGPRVEETSARSGARRAALHAATSQAPSCSALPGGRVGPARRGEISSCRSSFWALGALRVPLRLGGAGRVADARWAPVGAAAERWHPLLVELVGDRLEGHALGSHRRDALPHGRRVAHLAPGCPGAGGPERCHTRLRPLLTRGSFPVADGDQG